MFFIIVSDGGVTALSCIISGAYGPSSKGKSRSCCQSLSLAILIVQVSLLLCSGDVETNPGPPECEFCGLQVKCSFILTNLAVDLIPDNLGQLYGLVSDTTKDKWFELGLLLGIDCVVLKDIEKGCSDTQICYLTMLSAWLNCTQPQPSWETLLTALDSVQSDSLAETPRKRSCRPTLQSKCKIHCPN